MASFGTAVDQQAGKATNDSSSILPVFHHPAYQLQDDDRLVKSDFSSLVTGIMSEEDEIQTLIELLSSYVRTYLKARFGFLEYWIPCDDAMAKCDILLSPNWDTAPRLLVLLQNHVGSIMGIWSRSTCLQKGLKAGSMIPFLEKAHEQGFAVIVCNPNLNSVLIRKEDGSMEKKAVHESSFPEEHVLYVYDNFVRQAQAQHVCLFGYGNGAMLCKEILQRQIVLSQQTSEPNRIAAIATVEASTIIQEDDSADVKAFLSKHAVNWEANESYPIGHTIPKTKAHLGVSQVLSVGTPGEEELQTTAWSVSAGMDSVFRFLHHCLQLEASPGSPTAEGAIDRGYGFALDEAARLGIPGPKVSESAAGGRRSHSPTRGASGRSSDGGGGRGGIRRQGSSSPKQGSGFFGRLRRMVSSYGSKDWSSSSGSHKKGLDGSAAEGLGGSHGAGVSGAGDLSPTNHEAAGCQSVGLNERLGIAEFDLLKVVGKGAFGKVMLARKKVGQGAGQVYAMKVLNKNSIVKKGQVEHTLSERSILCEIRHPFIVRLRFAFQNEQSLYLVTDYYTGGSLFYHLRKINFFAENRAKFYAAELLMALDHLHQQFIIYRDLKLENVLMDSEGHIALTDFGLSKQNVKTEAGATTFCGTAEYIAPELLRGQAYGAAVDWWSFGVLLYEMMEGKTPFYNKNRKYMFHCIVHVRPTFPATFSKPAQHLLLRLMDTDPQRRLCSGERGAKEIMEHEFFRDIDFGRLYRKKVSPPYHPKTKGDLDMKHVPSSYQKMEPKESIAEPITAETAANVNKQCSDFKAFTYDGDSPLI